jgi:DNA-binding transcriptional LysR family regulator
MSEARRPAPKREVWNFGRCETARLRACSIGIRPGGPVSAQFLARSFDPSQSASEVGVTDFARRATSSDTELVGTVRVTCPETAGYRMMKSPLLDAFHSRYPGLRVEMVVDRILDLAKGEADIAFRASVPQDNSLVARKVAEVPWAVFASRTYIERRGSPPTVHDINAHGVIQFDGPIAGHTAARRMKGDRPACPCSGALYQYAGAGPCRKIRSGHLAAPDDRRTARA